MRCLIRLLVCSSAACLVLVPQSAVGGRSSIRTTQDYDEDEAAARAEGAITDIEEADKREQEIDEKIDASHDEADEAEIEEEVAEAMIAENAIAAEDAKRDASPDGALERLMAELVAATYELRAVNQDPFTHKWQGLYVHKVCVQGLASNG
ncbi:hypothetical protein BESB_014110 [Besnoitia besnoiti]|uniref:Uncharacterized protein n=1 Tax=Besnoitia besnoiti TaxID=94643 RepID=A0A2A9M4C5_BESBE|nr:hypothetical protein BESB_014110 [Besnoitia besnoiti]PFH32799.1 hypothetical protein BESB_014110 [Besnoitia besnoiti]